MASSNRINESNGFRTSAKLTLLEEPASNLKLTLFEDPAADDKKPITEPPKIPLQKRILIAKEAPKEESKREEPPARE